MEKLSKSLAEASADAARNAAARREASTALAALEQRLRADLDRESAVERRLATDIRDLEQRLESVRREQAKETAEVAMKAAELESAIKEREAVAQLSEVRIADLKDRLLAAESLWDGVQKPEVVFNFHYRLDFVGMIWFRDTRSKFPSFRNKSQLIVLKIVLLG